MQYRRLGKSGLNVPVLSFGTATFGGTTEFFKTWGTSDLGEAKRLLDICFDHGVNFFDTANGYSRGVSEEILGAALVGRRHEALISTKATFPMGSGPNDYGSSRIHLTKSCEDSLRRLKTDYIDLFFMHGFDSNTPVEETLNTLDTLVRAGKIRYIGCSNFSGWHLMKSLAISNSKNLESYVTHQVYYSLVGRDYENELMPLGLDQGIGAMVWSPLAGGALTGKISRDQKPSKDTRVGQKPFPDYDDELLYNVVDVLREISKEREKTISQIALNWLLCKPTVANIVVGARNEKQLKENFGAIDWQLTKEEIERLDRASQTRVAYPYWHQQGFPQLMAKPPNATL